MPIRLHLRALIAVLALSVLAACGPRPAPSSGRIDTAIPAGAFQLTCTSQ
jgi:hypothetical protein